MTKKALWVDDDRNLLRVLAGRLSDSGIDVVKVGSIAEVRKELAIDKQDIGCVIIDLLLPPDEHASQGLEVPGLQLAREIRTDYPQIRLIGLSIVHSGEAVDWFREFGAGYFCKLDLLGDWRGFAMAVETAIRGSRPLPQTFIVHGQNRQLLLDLKNYLQNTLGLPEPKVLLERPSRGRTIIEKFEDEAARVDIVFVLLSGDDFGKPREGRRQGLRGRQNVIFEMGYFFARLKRRSGRLVVLTTSGVELPSDIHGVVYIDVSKGIESAGESIRRELASWLRDRDA